MKTQNKVKIYGTQQSDTANTTLMRSTSSQEDGYFSRRHVNCDDDQSGEDEDNLVEVYKRQLEEKVGGMVQDPNDVDTLNKPNSQFKNYKNVFQNLLHTKNYKCQYPLVTAMFLYDATRVVTVNKESDKIYHVKMYGTSDGIEHFSETFKGSYIKMKDVEQNYTATMFAVTYLDDGVFKLRVFTKQQRTQEEAEKAEFNLNDLLGLDNWTMAINNFPDPFINCCFINEEMLFINLFHSHTCTHYHFFFNFKQNKLVGQVVNFVIGNSKKNFPYKSFYNDDLDEVYSFYRQGYALIVQTYDPNKYQFDRITELDLGQMYLIFNKALAVRVSTEIILFRLVMNEDLGKREWTLYQKVPIRGFLYFIRGNIRFQIATEEKIYFFKVCKEELTVSLDNVMYNYMNCVQMMIGPSVRFSVTYKTGEKSFNVFRANYIHNFKVSVEEKNLEGSKGIEIVSNKTYLCTRQDGVYIYDTITYDEIGQLDITLLESDSREPNQVLAIQKCQNEEYLAICTGRNLIKAEQKVNQLFIFKRKKNEGSRDTFELHERVVVKELPIFEKVCMDFFFKNDAGLKRDSVIFARQEQIFTINFKTKEVKTLQKFKTPLNRQPQFFNPNDKQDIFVVSSPEDGIFININSKEEVDIDELFSIGSIKEIIFEETSREFYILANKHDQKLGFFLIKFDESNVQNYRFLIKQMNKLDVGDAKVYINIRSNHSRELVVSYKSIYINTYTIIVLDITSDNDKTMLFRHESFQLWESEIEGTLLESNKDFVTINKDGMHVVSLGSQPRRPLKDGKGVDRMLHSLESMSFLKLDDCNFINFSSQNMEKREVQIQQEFYRGDAGKEDGENLFQNLYSIKIWAVTLRELLLFKSIYYCKTLEQIYQLILEQPNPSVFYKSLLELDAANMVSILSFDGRSLTQLLSEEFQDYFSSTYPIFYKNKFNKGTSLSPKFFYRNAIDQALKSNQSRAVSAILNYIVQFQNNYLSSFLFRKNFHEILDAGIELGPLLASDVFVYKFDFDEWPSTHTNDETTLRPYNQSVFSIRQHYLTVFPDESFARLPDIDDVGDIGQRKNSNIDSSKIFKIDYCVNLLPSVCSYIQNEPDGNGEMKKIKINEDIDIMELLSFSEEYEIFHPQSMLDFIEFKWNQIGFPFHMIGFTNELVSLVLLIIYCYSVYIKDNLYEFVETDDPTMIGGYERIPKSSQKDKQDNKLAFILLIGLFYPSIYTIILISRIGPMKLLKEPHNVDARVYGYIVFLTFNILTVLLQRTQDPQEFTPKVLMLVVIFLYTTVIFKYLSIIKSYSPLVQMLAAVINDLRHFLIMFAITILIFSLVITILQNEPSEYYQHLGPFMGNIVDTFKLSMGDFEMIGRVQNSKDHFIIFWISWYVIVLVLSIIFLNFIIAEASASYEKVSELLAEVIIQDQCNLLSEAEKLSPQFVQDEYRYPKYLIKRQVSA